MWPLAWSLLNFPPNLRDKFHLGLHLASFDTGSEAALILFARELLDLWENPIICTKTHKKYRLAMLQIIADGPGLCKVTKTTGCACLYGCNLCDFNGITYANGVYADAYRRYLPPRHPLRRCRSVGLMQFEANELRPPPVQRSYEDFHEAGLQAEAKKREILDSPRGTLKKANAVVVEGVKGVWAFDILPYVKHIVWQKDSMHAFFNAIQDAIYVITPTSRSGYITRENRTEKASVRTECR